MIDKPRFSEINKLRIINRELVYPAYRLARYFLNVFAVPDYASSLRPFLRHAEMRSWCQAICERYAAFRKTLGERFKTNESQLKAFCGVRGQTLISPMFRPKSKYISRWQTSTRNQLVGEAQRPSWCASAKRFKASVPPSKQARKG